MKLITTYIKLLKKMDIKKTKIITFNITLILLAIIVVVLWAYLINEYIKI